LGELAKAHIHGDLLRLPKDMRARDWIALFRTALEVDGQLGGPEELHLHQHTTLPPKVQEMQEDKMKELLALKEGNRTLEPAEQEPVVIEAAPATEKHSFSDGREYATPARPASEAKAED
jgi:hypothetical protein